MKQCDIDFTTHYCELLDLFNRQDNVFIARAEGVSHKYVQAGFFERSRQGVYILPEFITYYIQKSLQFSTTAIFGSFISKHYYFLTEIFPA